jgi:hypothetical protein
MNSEARCLARSERYVSGRTLGASFLGHRHTAGEILSLATFESQPGADQLRPRGRPRIAVNDKDAKMP